MNNLISSCRAFFFLFQLVESHVVTGAVEGHSILAPVRWTMTATVSRAGLEETIGASALPLGTRDRSRTRESLSHVRVISHSMYDYPRGSSVIWPFVSDSLTQKDSEQGRLWPTALLKG